VTYSIDINVDRFDISATSTKALILVTPPDYALTTTVAVNTFQVNSTNTVTNFDLNFNAVYLRLENLNMFWQGTWVSERPYLRGDIVQYQYSTYVLKNFNVDVTATYSSTTPPNQDPTYWTQIYWHEAPMANLTVTNTSTLYDVNISNNMVVGSGTFSGSARFNGTATFANTATFLAPLVSNGTFTNTNRAYFNTATISGLFNVRGESEFFDNVYFKDNATAEYNFDVGGDLHVTGGVNVDGSGVFQQNLSAGGYLDVTGTSTFRNNVSIPNSGLTVKNMTVTNNLMVGGLLYPNYKGTYGQVLTTNGATTASWVNLGDLQSWSLNENLYTNGFNIGSGNSSTQLTLGSGVPTSLVHSYLKFTDGSHVELGSSEILLQRKGDSNNHYLKIYKDTNNDYFDFNFYKSPVITFRDAQNGDRANVRIEGRLSVEDDLQIDGILQPTGFVEVGSGGIKFSDGTILTSANSATIAPATTSSLGAVIVGEYLTVSGGFPTPAGTISVNTTSLRNAIGSGSGIVPIATTSSLGIVQIGQNLSINVNGVLNADYAYASTNTVGIVRIGDGISVTALGLISINTSTFTSSGLDADRDVQIHDYKIKSDSNAGSPYLRFRSFLDDLNDYNAFQVITEDGSINIHPNRMEIAHNTGVKIVATTATISANTTTIGASVNNSVLRVQNIYNYAGTNAPFFPAGVQYQDNTIQRTAWQGYDQGLI
jgi:hypothetical protein